VALLNCRTFSFGLFGLYPKSFSFYACSEQFERAVRKIEKFFKKRSHQTGIEKNMSNY